MARRRRRPQGVNVRLRPILVLGVERSGTSLVSDLIHRWGADSGDLSRHVAADDHNPRGYFEYQPMQAFLHDILVATHASLWDPELRGRMERLARDPRFGDRALALIAEMEASGRPWLWKDPLLSLEMPFWERFLPAPVCVVTLRNPIDSGRSFARMNFSAAARRRLRTSAYFGFRWQFTMLAILDYLERNPDQLFVGYERLLAEPAAQVSRLCRFLDAQLAPADAPAERLARMLDAVEPALWRNRAETSFLELPEVIAEQKELLRYLDRRAQDHAEPFARARYPLPAYAVEYLEDFNLLAQRLHRGAPGNAKIPEHPGARRIAAAPARLES
jgi:hypothetical protein